MMSLFNLPVTHKQKEVFHHPWENTIKNLYSNKIKTAHNSVNNPEYPKKHESVLITDRVKFTIIGNRVTKEFIYCLNLVRGLHKYRWKIFDPPLIRGVTGVEWPIVLNDLKVQYGALAYCLTSQVAVLYNEKFLGGNKELIELIESKYTYYLRLNYPKESVFQFAGYVKSSGRPCAYMHVSINKHHIGTLIFMLYADIVPYTCENFLRLCKEKKGGYSGTPVHRIVKDGWIQCGGFGLKSVELDCENFIIPHDRRGVLCMANDGRHMDCSTQFFVLLQPAPWMEHKYVAFGYLIDGEATLQKIENAPTWYESPTERIIIHHAGILNLDCQDIMINRGANKYIQGHIEDLVTIGDIFMELLMERVFLEIQFRDLQRMEQSPEGEGAEEHKDLRATQRFMRKKEEIQKQLDKSILDSNRPSSGGSRPVSNPNNDFDVESYAYEPEEFSYRQASVAPSLPPKQEKPFYLPLTDVLYPGEVNSTYDLKKFLKGDYCLESDLTTLPKKDQRNVYHRKISEYFSDDDYEIENKEDVDLDSDEEQELKKYLKQNLERISCAGDVVRGIAKTQKGMLNIFEQSPKSELLTEGLRRFRLASADMRRRDSKKVAITTPVWDKHVHTKIKRRQTGFVREEDFEKILVFHRQESNSMTNDDDESEVKLQDDFEHTDGKVRIEAEAPTHETYIHRRPTGFARPAADDAADDGGKDNGGEETEGPKVRIAPLTEIQTEGHTQIQRRPTSFVRTGHSILENENGLDSKDTRPSVLARLYDELKRDDDEKAPTLKNYKPLSELQRKNILLTQSYNLDDLKGQESVEKYHRYSIQIPEESYDQVLNLQHSKKVARKVSSDYVNTIDQIERVGKIGHSIRSVEYAKSRPVMSVNEYQQKNQKYQNERKESNEATKSSRGLRLPGDSPLYTD